jgi:hypothetical protein
VEKRKTNVEISVGCSPIIISANVIGLGEGGDFNHKSLIE